MIEALIARMQRRWRERRMALFLKVMAVRPGTLLLDVGGRPAMWMGLDRDIHVTLSNLPCDIGHWRAEERALFEVIPADICRSPALPSRYDLVFSNSVLEHVGSAHRQAQFAAAVSSAGAYWVQVPAPCFPIEVHCRMLYWWLLPVGLRRRKIRNWHRAGLPVGRQMAGTRPIDRRRLQALFPDAEIITERWMGFPKSYFAYRRAIDVQRRAGS